MGNVAAYRKIVNRLSNAGYSSKDFFTSYLDVDVGIWKNWQKRGLPECRSHYLDSYVEDELEKFLLKGKKSIRQGSIFDAPPPQPQIETKLEPKIEPQIESRSAIESSISESISEESVEEAIAIVFAKTAILLSKGVGFLASNIIEAVGLLKEIRASAAVPTEQFISRTITPISLTKEQIRSGEYTLFN